CFQVLRKNRESKYQHTELGKALRHLVNTWVSPQLKHQALLPPEFTKSTREPPAAKTMCIFLYCAISRAGDAPGDVPSPPGLHFLIHLAKEGFLNPFLPHSDLQSSPLQAASCMGLSTLPKPLAVPNLSALST
ncbi:hypothetical protein P7K49_029512, partial [Saguinus oedipus]